MTYLSMDNKIVSQEANEGDKAVKPFSSADGVRLLTELSIIKSSFRHKTGITDAQWDVLMVVANNWETSRCGISIYGICKRMKPSTGVLSLKSLTHYKVVELLKHGHVEIIGYGKGNCSLYAPSRLTGDLLRSLSVA